MITSINLNVKMTFTIDKIIRILHFDNEVDMIATDSIRAKSHIELILS